MLKKEQLNWLCNLPSLCLSRFWIAKGLPADRIHLITRLARSKQNTQLIAGRTEVVRSLIAQRDLARHKQAHKSASVFTFLQKCLRNKDDGTAQDPPSVPRCSDASPRKTDGKVGQARWHPSGGLRGIAAQHLVWQTPKGSLGYRTIWWW